MDIVRRHDVAVAALLGVALALALPGCEADDTRYPPPAWLVRAVERDTGAPVAGVKVVALDARHRLAAPPAATGADGTVLLRLDETAAAPVRLAVFPGDSLVVHQLPPALVWPGGGAAPVRRPGPGGITRVAAPAVAAAPPAAMASAAATSAATPLAARSPAARPPNAVEVVLARRVQVGGLPRIRGHVVDATSGAPLAGAFVSLSPYPGALLGRAGVSDDVTLADGAFRVSDIPFLLDPGSDRVRQVLPLLVTREGYRARNWTHEPGAAAEIDVTGAVIALEPDEGGPGVLIGRVVFLDNPVPGLAVGLGSIGEMPEADPRDKTAVGWPGRLAVTGSDGSFRFSDLPAGGYVVYPGFRPQDGWVFPGQPAARVYAVTGDEPTVTDELRVLREVRPLAPLGRVPAAERFVWTAVAVADSYVVFLDGDEIGRTAALELQAPEAASAPGWHAWDVVAFTAAAGTIGVTETPGRFRVLETR
ncbi:MAG: carboxypeptidase-like regulatory domain-containing protein [Candidatus Krumholzibacteriia bacterium]